MVNLHALTASPRSDSPLSDPHIDPESDPLHVTPSVPGEASTTAIATTPTITAAPPPTAPNPQPSALPSALPPRSTPPIDPDRHDFPSLHRQGRIHLQKHNYRAAQSTLLTALGQYQPYGPVTLPQLAALLIDLAAVYGSCNQPQAQETCLRRALHCCGILQAARGRADTTQANVTADTTQANSTQANPADWELALAIVEPLIDLYWHQNRWTDVTPLFPLALRIHQHRGSSEDRSVARILRRWGEVDLGQGRYAKAEVRLRAALNLYRQQKNAKTPTVAQCWYLLAQVYERQGREDKALALLEWLLAWSPLGTEDLCEVQVAIVLAIGPFYQARGQLSPHLQLYRQALKTCGPRLGSHHPHIQALQAQLLQLAPGGSYSSPPVHVSTPRSRDPMV